MKIGINALYLLPGKVGGSETYVRNLVKWLVRTDRKNEYFIFVNRESAGVFESLTTEIRIIHCPVKAVNRPLRIIWEQTVLPLKVRFYRIDILLSAGLTAPFLCPATSVLVLYDLQHVNQPQNFPRLFLLFLRSIIYWSARSADAILTISYHVKDEIVRLYRIPPERIAVSHLAVDHDEFSPANGYNQVALKTKYDLPEHYILYAAALLPHKNHERLLRAFKQIRDEIPGWKLVFTGAWEKGRDKVAGLISEMDLEQDVILLGWLSFGEIPLLYRGASIFVFPTLHEGFGLPVLEAMASGVPVVCSRIAPLTEVAGTAAMYIDPDDHSDIARGILAIVEDKALRAKLIAEGIRRAGEFTWEKTALNTLSFLSAVHGRSKKDRMVS